MAHQFKTYCYTYIRIRSLFSFSMRNDLIEMLHINLTVFRIDVILFISFLNTEAAAKGSTLNSTCHSIECECEYTWLAYLSVVK